MFGRVMQAVEANEGAAPIHVGLLGPRASVHRADSFSSRSRNFAARKASNGAATPVVRDRTVEKASTDDCMRGLSWQDSVPTACYQRLFVGNSSTG